MQDGWKAVWSIQYISVSFFPSLKQNFIAYHSSKVSLRPDCIFEIDHQWQSGLSRMYSNCCCSCSFEPEIIIGQSYHKIYSYNILNFQESRTILNACTKKVWKLIDGIYIEGIYIYIYIYTYIYWRYIYIYIYIYISSSSSCRAGSTDIPDPLSPLLPIVHRPRQVLRTTSRILT